MAKCKQTADINTKNVNTQPTSKQICKQTADIKINV